MNCYIFVILTCLIASLEGKLKRNSPPHCTQVSKDTDYVSNFKMDYPVAYIHPGQREVYQKLYCVNPPAVRKAVTVVCDWAAPPQVQFTIGDDYMHVVRQDPSGQYLGNAVITTYQLCNNDSNSTTIIHIEDGTISQHETDIIIPVQQGMNVTYVEVEVNSQTPPNVEYIEDLKKIIIYNSLRQITPSKYSLYVKAVCTNSTPEPRNIYERIKMGIYAMVQKLIYANKTNQQRCEERVTF
ncbi:unnamed protein product [Leptidea sinapis]|uniref:Uncharacterized protein n=1 Tax=Leptidea sinapis TaxID=189913 RepID=A0A5E4QUA2_9NEOP|nr:unnamed protein product [Leptidea sinapis]